MPFLSLFNPLFPKWWKTSTKVLIQIWATVAPPAVIFESFYFCPPGLPCLLIRNRLILNFAKINKILLEFRKNFLSLADFLSLVGLEFSEKCWKKAWYIQWPKCNHVIFREFFVSNVNSLNKISKVQNWLLTWKPTCSSYHQCDQDRKFDSR